MSTDIGGLTTATKLLADEIKGTKRDLGKRLEALEIAFDELLDFFKTSGVDTHGTLETIKSQLVETNRTLKLLMYIESDQVLCDAKSWSAFKDGIGKLDREQFSPLFDAIDKYIKNLKDIEPKLLLLSVKEIGEKNELFVDNRKQIREAIEDLYDIYKPLRMGIKW